MKGRAKKGPAYAIGADIGGTSVRCGLVSARGRIRRGSFQQVPVDSKGPRECILQTFATPLRENFRQAAREGLDLIGIGVGMCGPLDYDRGICLIQGVDKYESLYGVHLKEEFRKRLGLPERFPINFEIDTWAFARGEAWRGAAKGFNRILALTLGTGLGSAFIADGQLLADGPGVPPPFGWIGGLAWKGGKLDDYVSRRGILALYRSLAGGPPAAGLDVKEIAARAKGGDSTCVQVFNEFGRRLGQSLAPILEEFGAECLILGGAISRAFELFEGPLRGQLTRLTGLQRITVARSIGLAAIRGAGHLAFLKAKSREVQGN